MVPSLLHAGPVTFVPRAPAAGDVDENAGEVVRGAGRGAPYVLPAQVHWMHEREGQLQDRQVLENSYGWVTVRGYDARRLGVALPARGDRISNMEGKEVRYYIVKTEPIGHYRGGLPTLLRAYFADREPTE